MRIDFDGDSVLFSDEAERVFRLMKLDQFIDHEVRNARMPLPLGPLQPFLNVLCRFRNALGLPVKILTALVTARSAPAHERAVRTSMAWGVEDGGDCLSAIRRDKAQKFGLSAVDESRVALGRDGLHVSRPAAR
ncbi:5'-nucleotidase [Paraburkholderia fungorum]|uniref:5'-nucleotidase n=1 Tax=Paraburkholderia fungorum TaxID=134537 RepID=UPI0038BAC925